LLLDGEAAAGEGDVVIGGEQGDQAEDKAADGLDEADMVKIKFVKTEPVAAVPGALQLWRFWRGLRLDAVTWRAGVGGGCWSQGEVRSRGW